MRKEELVQEIETLRILANRNGKSPVGHKLSLLVGRIVKEGITDDDAPKVSVGPGHTEAY